MILQQSLAPLFNSYCMIIQQWLARLFFNSHWHDCSTVTDTIVQQSRARFFLFSKLSEFFKSDVNCWRIVPCTRNTTHAVLERIVLVVLVYKKMKPIILFSHCFLPNLFQNVLINFLTLKRAHYIKNRFNLTKFYQKREKLTLIEKDKVAENDINAAQILNTSFANICK